MADVTLNGSSLGSGLTQLLMADDIVPGTAPSYQVCKTIYEFHPLGQKIAEAPIKLAQSQKREITIPGTPEDRVKKAFINEWEAIGADKHIMNIKRLSRIYGVASMAIIEEDGETGEPLDFDKLAGANIGFNALDPLNTAGSLVLNQDPNAIDFQKHKDISVNGKMYHRSRTVVILNEQPIYIGYTVSAFGYVGRSAYQRSLYPLKSFIQSMVTDDMITRKAGVIVAKMKQPGSIIDNVMQKVFATKRAMLKDAKTDNVLGISPDEDITTLDLTNIDGAGTFARTNILKNVASGADMPAALLDQETMVSGFGEGTEDAKNIAHYIDGFREEMNPIYNWFDKITMYRAWNKEFYKTIQKDFPDQYAKVSYEEAFYQWSTAFNAEWPNLLTEPDSEKSKTEKVKLEALVSATAVLAPMLDPENKIKVVDWVADNLNEMKLLFPAPLTLDIDALANWTPPDGASSEDGDGDDHEPKQPRPHFV